MPTRSACLFCLAALDACAPPHGIPPMKCPTIPAARPGTAAPPPPRSGPPTALAPGHWDWADASYAWVPPSWLPRPPHPRWPAAPALWQDGYWRQDAGACVWTAGGFVS